MYKRKPVILVFQELSWWALSPPDMVISSYIHFVNIVYDWKHSIVYMYSVSSMNSCVGYLGWLPNLSAVNPVLININVQVSMWFVDLEFFWINTQSDIYE